jgi:hypothetical protein
VKFKGQERWLEQRQRREARSAAGLYGVGGSSSSLFGGASGASVGGDRMGGSAAKGKGPLRPSASEGGGVGGGAGGRRGGKR